MNKIFLIFFILLTGCTGIQTIVNGFVDPIPVPDNSPPVYTGTIMTIYFNGEISIPIIDGTYKWIRDSHKKEIGPTKNGV